MTRHDSDHEGTATTSESMTDLARDARKVLAGLGNPMEAVELLRRIDRMRAASRSRAGAPAHAWLESLRGRVERV